MSRGNKSIQRSIALAVKEELERIVNLSTDEIRTEHASCRAQYGALVRQCTELRRKLDLYTNEMRRRKEGDEGMIVSDHAVLRYLQRVRGINVNAVRGEIRAIAAQKIAKKTCARIVEDSATGLRVAVSDDDHVITVWTPAEDRGL